MSKRKSNHDLNQWWTVQSAKLVARTGPTALKRVPGQQASGNVEAWLSAVSTSEQPY